MKKSFRIDKNSDFDEADTPQYGLYYKTLA